MGYIYKLDKGFMMGIYNQINLSIVI
jgi:hypothetical protein